jgi:hypothetical protein
MKEEYSLKEVKKIIDGQKITKELLPACGITTYKFVSQFFSPDKNPIEYKEAYQYLFNRFKELETI